MMTRSILVSILLLASFAGYAQKTPLTIAGSWTIDSSVTKTPEGTHNYSDLAKQTWEFKADSTLYIAEPGSQPEKTSIYTITKEGDRSYLTMQFEGAPVKSKFEIILTSEKNLILKSAQLPEMQFSLFLTRRK